MNTPYRTFSSVVKIGLFVLTFVAISLLSTQGTAKGNWQVIPSGTPQQSENVNQILCDECDGFPGTWRGIAANGAPAARRDTPAVWTGTEMLLWGGRDAYGFLDSGYRYNVVTGTWTPMSTTNAPGSRTNHSMVWTGTELLVWGGWTQGGPTPATYKLELKDGARYNPLTNTWTPISDTGAPSARESQFTVWTGREMIVWGGIAGGLYYPSSHYDGARYNPATDTWTPIPPIEAAPYSIGLHHVVWTGNELLVWGGYDSNAISNGMRYNVSTNTWKPMSTTGMPSNRIGAAAVWTGTEMIIWGGVAEDQILNDGGRYNPVTDTWETLSNTNAPTGLRDFSTVWTGDEMIIWGGLKADDTTTNEGARYNPATDTWTKTATLRAPTPRWLHTALWTGREMLVFGGSKNLSIDPQYLLNDGGRYNFYQFHFVHLPGVNR